MESGYLYTLAAFYIVTWIVTMGYSIAASNERESFPIGVFLGVLLFANNIDDFWLHPETMAVYHIYVVVLMCLALNGKRGFVITLITFFVFLSDMFWVWLPSLSIEPMAWNFPHDYFYWQSILNLSLLVQCLISIHGCRNALKIDRINKRIEELEGDDTLEASEGAHVMGAHVD